MGLGEPLLGVNPKDMNAIYTRRIRELQSANTREVERKRRVKAKAIDLLENLHTIYMRGKYTATDEISTEETALGFAILDAIQEMRETIG